MIYLLEFPVLLLIMPASVKGILLYFIFYVIGCFFLSRYKKIEFIERKLSIKHKAPAVFVSLLLAVLFYVRWRLSSKVAFIAGILHLPVKVFLIFATLFMVFLSIGGIGYLFDYAYELTNTNICENSIPDKSTIKSSDLLFLLITSVVVMMICTKSSPIYPFNDWVDSNAFFTVGKSMLQGMVPYRDLFEHKGPLLYFIHALSALISFHSFGGVFCIEVVSCFSFLLLFYLILRIYFDSSVINFIPIMAALVYTPVAFCHGDSVEELCFPLLAYGFYVSIKALHNSEIPSLMECFLVGITSACVLWMKFTILGFYMGWIIVPAFICVQRGQMKKLFSMFLMIILGVLTTTVPILIYFGIHGAINDLFEVYFYDNLFLYSMSGAETQIWGVIANIINGFSSLRSVNFVAVILICFGCIWCLSFENMYVIAHYFLIVVGTFSVVYCGGRSYTYYGLIFGVFTVLGFAFFYFLLQGAIRKFKKTEWMIRAGCEIVAIIVMVKFSSNTYMIHYTKEDLPQFKVKEVIENSGIENPTLLNYGFLDGGFYTATGITPTVKYFYKSNLPLEEMVEQQKYYVDNRMVDFIVTTNTETEFSEYKYIDSFSYNFEGYERIYLLYRLKNVNQ